jgi:hypothetical protein
LTVSKQRRIYLEVRIFVFTLAVVWAMFAGLIVGALKLGEALPESTLVRQLRLSDCTLPCWIGIVPGITSTDEALSRVSEIFALPYQLPSSNEVTSSVWVEMPTLDAILVHLEFVEGVNSRILIQGKLYGILDSMPRVGDIISLFGTPSCVNPQSPGFMGWSLFYDMPDGVTVVGVLGRDSISWTQPIYFMYMRPRNVGDAYESCSTFQQWRGLNRSQYHHFS